jgi:hypothetical protein
LVCPGHIHFDQLCTHERCVGYWAARFDEGEFGGVKLRGVRAIVFFDSPQHMIDGEWTEAIVIDDSATQEQRAAAEAILSGRAGGPWEVLGRFVARRLETRYLPIEFVEDGAAKSARIMGVLEAAITEIRGRDRKQPVRFENIFNQIHAPEQVLALGTTEYDDGVIRIHNEKTHGLHSRFEWRVE